MKKQGLRLKYFVLSPTKKDAYGIASRKAIVAYAKAINAENSELAHALIDWLKELEPVGTLSEEAARFVGRES